MTGRRFQAFFLLLFLAAAPCTGQTTATAQQSPLARRQYPSLPGKRVLFLGDSITANGQYVSILEYYLNRANPARPADFISLGLASETLSGLSEKAHPFPRPVLFNRLQRALDLVKPDIIFACYGMNDGIYHPSTPERFDAFKAGVTKLVDASRKAGAQLILLTPPPFDEQAITTRTLGDGASDYSYKQPYRQYGAVLEEYSRWMLSLRDHGVHVIDVNRSMRRVLERRRQSDPKYTHSPDGIHPSPVGHLHIARVLMRALDIPFEGRPRLADPEQLMARIEADPLYQMIDARRRARASGWIRHVGYTRGETIRTKDISNTEAAAESALAEIVEYMGRHSERLPVQQQPAATTATLSRP